MIRYYGLYSNAQNCYGALVHLTRKSWERNISIHHPNKISLLDHSFFRISCIFLSLAPSYTFPYAADNE